VALPSLLVNLPPYLIVRAASRRVEAPVTKGTVRLLVAIVAFPLTWGIAAWLMVGFGWDWLVFVVGYALAGFVAVLVLEQTLAAAREIVGWRNLRNRRGFAAPVLEHRELLVAQVLDAASASTATPAADSTCQSP
jgi:hypothetical protein